MEPGETTYPTWTTVSETLSEAKNGVEGLSKVCNRTTEAVAPHSCAAASRYKVLSTYKASRRQCPQTSSEGRVMRTSKKARVDLASRSISCFAVSTSGETQGARAPPLKRLKYPSKSFVAHSYNSGTCDLSADSKRPWSSCRRNWETVEPP